MRIHFSSLVSALLLLGSTSCNHSSGDGASGPFDYLFFVRQGGGDKVFTVNQQPFVGGVSIIVTRIHFRDTVVQFVSAPDQANAVTFSSFDDALHAKIPIEGNFSQPTSDAGSWAYLYMVRAGQRFEITNSELRNRLLGFEALVENKLPLPK